MAGFEVIVRPAIFPNIRPTARQSLPPQDDPEKGFAVIRGQPAITVDLTTSTSVSASSDSPKEVGRTVDEVRVYQKDADGTINKDNFVDVYVPTEIQMKSGVFGGKQKWRFTPQEASESEEVRRRSIQKRGAD